VKVTPSIGSVKYKAQHVVLAVRIPKLTGCKRTEAAKIRGLAVEFCEMARDGRVYFSGTQPCLRVGAMVVRDKAQEWCRLCGWRWKSGNSGLDYTQGGYTIVLRQEQVIQRGEPAVSMKIKSAEEPPSSGNFSCAAMSFLEATLI
jgi:hypothetical protein